MIVFVACLFVVVLCAVAVPCWLCIVYYVFVVMLCGCVLRSGSAHCDLILAVEVRQCRCDLALAVVEVQKRRRGEEEL